MPFTDEQLTELATLWRTYTALSRVGHDELVDAIQRAEASGLISAPSAPTSAVPAEAAPAVQDYPEPAEHDHERKQPARHTSHRHAK